MELAGLSMFVAFLVGVPAGVIAAKYRNKWPDRFLVGFTVVGHSVPSFILAIGMIFLFTLWLGWLPSSGRGGWQHLVLPVIALAWGSASAVARITRSSMLNVMGSDFVRTARAKGLSEAAVLRSHVLRNALIPILTLVAQLIGTSIAGAIVVETVFAWPGMGRVVEQAVSKRDFAVIQLVVLLIATSVVFVNIVADIAYAIVDPRIRYVK